MNRDAWIGLFVDEARELLERARKAIDALHSEPEQPHTLKQLLRSFHSLKGMAATLAIEPFVELSHRLEDLVQQLLAQPRLWGDELLPLLEEGVDRLDSWTDDIAGGRLDLDATGELSARVASQLTPDRGEAEPAAGASHRYDLQLTVAASSQPLTQRLVRTFRRLSGVAHVIRVRPPQLPIDERPRPVELRCELRSDESAATLEQTISRFPGVLECRIRTLEPTTEFEEERPKTWTRVPLESLDAIADDLRDLAADLDRNPQRARYWIRRLYGTIDELRRQPLGSLQHRLAPAVYDAARRAEKNVTFEMLGGEIGVERDLLDRLVDPLRHLVRNAVAHGIEPTQERERSGKQPQGVIRVSAERDANGVRLRVEDDGRGFDLERLRQLSVDQGCISPDAHLSRAELHRLALAPQLSTKDEADRLAGRGVGLAGAVADLEELGAHCSIDSTAGEGSRIDIDLPLRQTLLHSLLFRRGGELFAVPLHSLRRAVHQRDTEVQTVIEPGIGGAPAPAPATLLECADGTIGVASDEIVGARELWVRSLTLPAHAGQRFIGAARTEEGELALVLDPEKLRSLQ